MLSILAIARPAKEVVSHTFRVEKPRFRWPTAFVIVGRVGENPGNEVALQRDERVGYREFFLSHRTSKIPSSLNKPVPYPDPRSFLEVLLHERES